MANRRRMFIGRVFRRRVVGLDEVVVFQFSSLSCRSKSIEQLMSAVARHCDKLEKNLRRRDMVEDYYGSLLSFIL